MTKNVKANDTRVYLSKMEGIGHVLNRNGEYRLGPYASRHRLVVFEGEPVIGVDGGVLRKQVEQAIHDEGGRLSHTLGEAIELSREYLFELAEKARSRDMIAAEKEPHQTI